jgi:toxin secretion/phage lysis holin
MKSVLCFAVGALGSVAVNFFGGWDTAFATLVIFIVLDYITGLVVAGVCGKSDKTKTGGLSSLVGFKGIAKKIIMLVLVAVAFRIDLLLNIDYVRNLAVIAFVTNEVISIVENAGLMGVPVPKVVLKAIDVLKSKSGESGMNEENC